ncbi:MAG: phage holin family protein [Oscillibacter sp.]|nr:phage holin family protein [Oscillibacter sp.]
MEHVNRFKAAIAAITGALTALWGWMGWLVVGWIVCMAADYLTGSMAAAKAGEWNSARAREGIWHKCGMIVVVLVAAGVDLLLEAALENLPGVQLPFAFGGIVCPMVLVWYIITELGSIAENGVSLGAPMPGWLVKLLKIGKDAVDSAGEKIVGERDGKQ